MVYIFVRFSRLLQIINMIRWNYYEIDPHFGDKQVFRKLVEKAHERGIRVMLDAVFNHLEASSHQWQDVILHGKASSYADWFHIESFPPRYTAIPDSENAKDLIMLHLISIFICRNLNTANVLAAEVLYWRSPRIGFVSLILMAGVWMLQMKWIIIWKKFHDTVLHQKRGCLCAWERFGIPLDAGCKAMNFTQL